MGGVIGTQKVLLWSSNSRLDIGCQGFRLGDAGRVEMAGCESVTHVEGMWAMHRDVSFGLVRDALLSIAAPPRIGSILQALLKDLPSSTDYRILQHSDQRPSSQ